MGTRSLTFVYTGQEKLLTIYRQYDGYPSGMGANLARLIQTANNGVECLAASIVAGLKTEWGNVYIYSNKATDCGQDFEYHIFEDKVIVKDYNGRQIFKGDYTAFATFCQE